LGLGIGLFAPRPARAAPCPIEDPQLAALAGVDVEERLRFLAAAFDRDVRNIDIWSWTWGSIYAGATIAQVVALPVVKDHGVRIDLSVGAVSSGVGAVSLYGLPLQITLPLRAVRRRWADPDRCALAVQAEAALVKAAGHEALANGVLAHVGDVLANVGLGLVLGLGYHRWQSAWISVLTGVAVGETNAFTQPHSLERALLRYRTGQLSPGPQGFAWTLSPLHFGGGWGLAFGASAF
jgi:hypothetical protein